MGNKTPLQKYLKHFEHNGPELLLETAARDADLSDAEYEQLYDTVKPKGAGGRKLADRDYARGQA